MDPLEHTLRISEEHSKLITPSERYRRNLEFLETTPFNFEVASDIDPILLGNGKSAREHLKFYSDFYRAIRKRRPIPQSYAHLRQSRIESQ